MTESQPAAVPGLEGVQGRHRAKLLRSPNTLPGDRGPFQRILFLLLSGLVKTFCRLKVSGEENIPAQGGYIICPNHSSHLDAFVVAMSLGKRDRFRIVSFAAQGYFVKGILRYMASLVGAVLIKRHAVSLTALRAGMHALEQELPLLIFPEGTRSRSGGIGKFHKGAAHVAIFGESPILPVRIKGTFEVLPPGKKLPIFRGNWGLFFRPCIEVTYLPVLLPDSSEDVPEELTEKVRAAIVGS